MAAAAYNDGRHPHAWAITGGLFQSLMAGACCVELFTEQSAIDAGYNIDAPDFIVTGRTLWNAGIKTAQPNAVKREWMPL